MRLLILCADYPNLDGDVSLNYVRTRNIFYKKKGYDVTVLNFATEEDYIIDQIPVVSLKSFEQKKECFDLLICHAPNLRNHYVFLKKYDKSFDKIVFFLHGHEVLNINKVYSKPYFYVHRNLLKTYLQNIYDSFKLRVWNKYFSKKLDKIHFIFVSNWMYNEFKKWVKLELPNDKYDITYNSIGESFENIAYDTKSYKKYDFITIRSYLDGSKYSIDIVNHLAKMNPTFDFLVVGKGDFFKYYKKASNLTWLDKRLNHSEIVELLNQSSCALMPTRTDAQGLMMCEMASFGIPLITSDIPVCHEVFDGFSNVELISNESINNKDFIRKYKSLVLGRSYTRSDKFFAKKTVTHECNIFKSFLEED